MAEIPVVDPVARAVLKIPLSKTYNTRGLTEYLSNGAARDVSLCCLFQQNRCRADSTCRQVHVDVAFVASQRAIATAQPSCCRECRGQSASASVVRFTGRATAGMPVLPASRFIVTPGLPAMTTPEVEIPWTSVCRLQLRDTCKYGDQCKNVHVCTKFGKQLLARAAINVNTCVPESVRAAAGTAFPAEAAPPVAVAVAPAVETPKVAVRPKPVESGFANRAVTVVAPEAAKPLVPPTVVISQPAAPLQLRANFPRLDEGSLQLADVDLEGLVFHLPTLVSASSAGAASEFCDLFSPSPVARTMCASPSTPQRIRTA